MATDRFFFIVGSPRSGTTLLQAMLCANPRFFIPPETHFMAAMRVFSGRSPKPDEAGVLEMLRREVCERNELPVDWEELSAELRGVNEPAAMFRVLLAHMGRRYAPGCRVGEKTPGHLLFADRLLSEFPDSQIINVIRDGRDVAVSHREAFDSLPLHSAYRWREHLQLHRRLTASVDPSRYTSVRYEDLVADPEAELRRLCAFLGEPFDPAMIRQHERHTTGFAQREQHKLRTLEPVTASRVGRYRAKLSRSELWAYQAVAGAELAAAGYAVDPYPSLAGKVVALLGTPRVLWHRFMGRRRVKARVQDRKAAVASAGGSGRGPKHQAQTR